MTIITSTNLTVKKVYLMVKLKSGNNFKDGEVDIATGRIKY
ncbi:MAG: hypothetical protein WAP58_04895 [Peptococcia bacterium]